MPSTVNLPIEILEIRLTSSKEYPWAAEVHATVKSGNRPRPEVVELSWNMTGRLFSDLIHAIASQYLHEQRMHDLKVQRKREQI